jgi:hypothetical protein
LSCKTNKKYLEIKQDDGELAKGAVINDSLFDGPVKYYDSLNNYLGFSIFKNGVENGLAVKYENGVISDSLFFENGTKNGRAYKFNSKGKLIYECFYYNDRMVGGTTECDSNGSPIHYYFVSFEGEDIFQVKYEDTTYWESGSPINAKVSNRLIDGKLKAQLFLYLFNPPSPPRHYEIAVLDSNRKIINSKKIDESNFFYETYLDTLPSTQSYAVVLHVFNKADKRNKLVISEIKFEK